MNREVPGASAETVAVLMPGDMGHAIGRCLREHGHDVITCLRGRGNHSCERADAAGLRNVPALDDIVAQAGLILSILPPAAAVDLAREVRCAMERKQATPVYVDCNAIAPASAQTIADIITGVGASFIDAGIIGPSPGKGSGPRFYVSGPNVAPMLGLDGKGFRVIEAGREIGKASAMKMVYAGLTKGTWTLHTAVLLAAERLGIAGAILQEFESSQAAAVAAMRARVPCLAADSARWVGEMEEIASTFSEVGVPSGFHESAAEIFRVLQKTPLASETRATMDTSRTLEEALGIYVKFLMADQ